MRILFFHHATTPGGAPKSLALLIRKLIPLGVEAVVAMPKRSDNAQVCELFVSSGARVIEEQHLRPFHGSTIAPNDNLKDKLYALGGFIPTAWAAKKIAAEVGPDIIHLNSTAIVAAAYGARRVDTKVPVVAHVREPILANAWGGVLRRLNVGTVDHFISIDDEGGTSVGAKPASVSVIRNSVDPANFGIGEADREKARQELGWTTDTPIFLSLSRMTEANGALALAQAIARIEGRISRDFKVVFAGFHDQPSGAYEAAVLDQIAQTASCVAMPFTDNVDRLLAGCDAIIAPFLTNHSSRSVFEGGAAGRPAIITRVPNLTELIVEGETGLSFDILDDEGLVAAIEAVCDPSTRVRMGSAARAFARQHFDADTNAASVLRIYEKLIAKGLI
tara:strand:+ start:8602 stop:9774 length:1173 start_codon:yes stop_codon:yes gene_type:complete